MRARLGTYTSAAIGASMLPVLVTGTAHAASWTAPDATGDVIGVSWEPEPEPCGTSTVHEYPEKTSLDIRKLGVRHGDSQVTLKATFVDLQPNRDQETTFELLTSDKRFSVSVRLRANGNAKAELWKEQLEEPVPDPECGGAGLLAVFLSCSGLAADIDVVTDVIKVNLPRRCVKKPRWVKAGAWTIDWWDDTVAQDHWEPLGSEGRGGVFGPYGPKVYRG